LHTKLETEIVAAVPLHVTPASPETLSLAVPFTPIAPAARAIVAPLLGEDTVRLGGVSSRFTVADVCALSPAASVTVPGTFWPTTSFDTVTADGQFTIGDTEGVQVNFTVAAE
jgi:hypothetical protein